MSVTAGSSTPGTAPVRSTVTVRYFAGARAAAGVSTENVALADGYTVSDLLGSLAARHGERMTRVLGASSLLLDEVAVRDRSLPLRSGAVLDVLPPFAGG
ncbi:MAG TPA: MoaD/ThiS family protein [Pseudonocardia sp.]|jgi:molybdopterin converting factor small subunit